VTKEAKYCKWVYDGGRISARVSTRLLIALSMRAFYKARLVGTNIPENIRNLLEANWIERSSAGDKCRIFAIY
jgi:hypothetical protein